MLVSHTMPSCQISWLKVAQLQLSFPSWLHGMGSGFEAECDMQKALCIEQLMLRKEHVKLLVVDYNACTTKKNVPSHVGW